MERTLLRKSRYLAAITIAVLATLMALAPGNSPASPRFAAVTPIKHVVVIYEENLSFDAVLGYWCDQNRRRCPDGGMPSLVTLSDGAVVRPRVSPNRVPQLNHSIAALVAAMDGGKMDGWQNVPQGGCDAASGYACISGYTPSQIPNITALASQFAVSDLTFSMADSPSFGGHVYAVAGSLDGMLGNNPNRAAGYPQGPGWGCDSYRLEWWQSSPAAAVRNVPACVPDRSLPVANGGAFKRTPVSWVPTIMDRLSAAHKGWRIYGAANGTQGGYQWATCPIFADCLDTPQHKNVVDATKFRAAALAGKLPAFTLVTPGGTNQVVKNSCHNGTSITACDNWIGSLVQAVESGPQWASTAIFITWDDFGGFYDQVPPPATLNADGQQAGPRSPVIIVSPFARRGFTDTKATSFAGILAYVEHNFGLSPLAANDAAAYPFTNAFNYSQTPLKPVRMVSQPLPASAKRITLKEATTGDS